MEEITKILKELQYVFSKLDPGAAEKAARAIEMHSRIFVCAAGRSFLMMKALSMRLMQMGKQAYVAGETTTPAIEEGDLLILASASGNTASVCLNAEKALEAGADLFVISASAASRLSQLHPADVLFLTGSKESGGESAQVMGSLFEQALLLFWDSVVLCLGPDEGQMKRRHANLE